MTGQEFSEDEVRVLIRKLASVIQYLHSRFICVRFAVSVYLSTLIN